MGVASSVNIILNFFNVTCMDTSVDCIAFETGSSARPRVWLHGSAYKLGSNSIITRMEAICATVSRVPYA